MRSLMRWIYISENRGNGKKKVKELTGWSKGRTRERSNRKMMKEG